jgi:hypothetical protein
MPVLRHAISVTTEGGKSGTAERPETKHIYARRAELFCSRMLSNSEIPVYDRDRPNKYPMCLCVSVANNLFLF